MAEFDLIARIAARAVQRPDVLLGIGDDAALLQPPAGQQLTVTSDTLNVGVHFLPETAAADIGWKSLAVNLSDLAAMGATPAWVVLSLSLPQPDLAFVEGFLDGFLSLAQEAGVSLVGGDTTQGPLSIGVTAMGWVPVQQALKRSAARVGEVVMLSGTTGDAGGALSLWQQGRETDSPSAQALYQRMARPAPRIGLGSMLRGRASACVDISDGLLADLGHIARASGVGIELEAAALPYSPALADCFEPTNRLRLQLIGGDDYELAFTLPEAEALALLERQPETGARLSRIGRVVSGQGVTVRDEKGDELVFERKGWEHFKGLQL